MVFGVVEYQQLRLQEGGSSKGCVVSSIQISLLRYFIKCPLPLNKASVGALIAISIFTGCHFLLAPVGLQTRASAFQDFFSNGWHHLRIRQRQKYLLLSKYIHLLIRQCIRLLTANFNG